MVEHEAVDIPKTLNKYWPIGMNQEGVDDFIFRLAEEGLKFFDRTIGPRGKPVIHKTDW